VHPRDNDLILGTHGRSIYIMDDITPLQQMTDSVNASADAIVFDIRPAVAWITDIQKSILAEGAKLFRAQNPAQGTAISYWLKSEPGADVRLTIHDVTGREIRVLNGTKAAGLNRVQWDLRLAGAGGRGRGQGGGGQAAGAPATPGGGQAGRGGAGGAAQPAAATPAPGRGGGRGGFGPAVAPGAYLVKVMVGDQMIGQKTIVVEADTTFTP
jgi:hypothetical protein